MAIRVNRRCSERGNTMLLAMLVFGSLTVLAGLTVVSTQGTMATTRASRDNAIARYAAESGGAAAMDYLRQHVDPTNGFTAFVTPNNGTPMSPSAIPGNNLAPGAIGNPFSPDTQAWYSVMILNNRNDAGLALGTDTDHSIIIYVTGYGPMGAVASLEWEVAADPSGTPGPLMLVGWREVL